MKSGTASLSPAGRPQIFYLEDSLTRTHLNLLVAEGEPSGRRQEPNHDAGQRQDAGAHWPVEGGDAGRGVLAGVTALGARQALVLAVAVVRGVLALIHI